MATEPTTGPMTGSGGDVSFDTAVADVRNWRVTRNNDVKTYVSSDTAGYTKTRKGNFSATGQFEMFLNYGAQSIGFEVGDLGDLVLTSSSGKTFTAEARISSIDIGVDIEGNDWMGATVGFEVDGTWAVV